MSPQRRDDAGKDTSVRDDAPVAKAGAMLLVAGNGRVSTYALDRELVIGRHAECDIAIDEIGRAHV